jgi:tetratricopeptide (TPR) repeat protein
MVLTKNGLELALKIKYSFLNYFSLQNFLLSVIFNSIVFCSSAQSNEANRQLSIEILKTYSDALKNKNYEQAIIAINKAIEIDNKESEEFTSNLYNSKGLVFHELKKHDDAIINYNAALKIFNNYMALYNRSISYREIKDFNNSLDDINKVIEAYDNFCIYYLERGKLLLQMKRKKEACVDFKKAAYLQCAEAVDYELKYCK